MLVEAMKMENVIYASRKAKVVKIFVKEQDLVNVNQDLIELS